MVYLVRCIDASGRAEEIRVTGRNEEQACRAACKQLGGTFRALWALPW